MTGRLVRLAAAIAMAIAISWLGACAPAPTVVVAMEADLPPSDPLLARAGPHPSTGTPGALRSSFGCVVRYEVHESEGWQGGMTVIVAHGFLRSLATMRGWAEHLASHGLRSVTVSFCNSSPFAGRHDRNARDLRDVADALVAEPGTVVYAGFSAGGLAALLAAAADARAVGYLGLDAVDSAGLAARAASWAGPSLFLVAEPSSCNARNDLLPVAERLAGARIVPIANATHCHFEDPYAPLCERFCGRIEPQAASDAVRDTIRSLATAWLLRLDAPR